MDDKEILLGIQQKNEKCYEILIDKYLRYVGAIALKISGDRLNMYDIEEICSDIFIKLWNIADRITLTGGSLKPYIAITTRNTTLNVLRSKKINLEEEFEEVVLTKESPENVVILNEERKIIKTVIASLKEPDREIFIRRYFYMEKVKDIASKIGMNEKAVSARISRAKEMLRSIFTEKGVL
ncbi:MAG: sigma-70 family RNA polymerase sigma factor [Clostridium lundense]|nr:sigma-70 family RNA polymerase sigma factor [Clostridium lundense]